MLPRHRIIIGNMLPIKRIPLTTLHGARLHHGSVLLLESLVQSGGALEVLVDTAHDASLLTVDERLGGEVIDTVIEATLNHLGVHLEGNEVRSGEDRWLTGEPGIERKFQSSRVLSSVDITYSHKLLELLTLHASGELALFRCVKSARY